MEEKEKALLEIVKDLYKQECKKSTRYLIMFDAVRSYIRCRVCKLFDL